MKKPKNLELKIGIVLFSIALAYNGVFFIRNLSLIKHGVETQGWVTSINIERGVWADIPPYSDEVPYIQYMVPEGELKAIRGCAGCNKIGDTVSVLYDPDNSDRAEVNSQALYFPLYYSLVFGFLLSLVILKFKRSRKAG